MAAQTNADSNPLARLIDLLAEKAVRDMVGNEAYEQSRTRRNVPAELRPSHMPEHAPALPLCGSRLRFRARFDDFVWSDRVTGDLVSQLGYRIYPHRFHDEWVVVDENRKRLGTYRDIHAAVARADAHAIGRLGTLDAEQVDALFSTEDAA